MRMTMKKLTQGATRLLVLALGLGLTATGWAATPVAVWDGDFTATQTGYTLDRNGNALSQDNSTITIDQSVGVKVDFGSGVGGMTVMFRYSDLAFDAQKTLATSFVNGQDENRTGVYLASGGTANGIANTENWNNPVGTLSEPSGVLAFTYSGSGGTALYYISSLGVRTQIYYKDNLRWGADSSINGCTIGGERAKAGATLLSAATDMKITAIAIFNSVLSQSDMEGYLFPTDDPTSGFDYVATITANTTLGDITTWTKGSGTPDAASKVYIKSENDAVLTIGGSLSLNTLRVVGGSIALANGASISSTEILGADVNIAASTEVTISDSTVRSKINCNGKLNTSGTTVLSAENEFASGSILNVGGTKTTLNAAQESLDGSIVIAAGAELENARTSDALDFNRSTIVDVYGTLNMGNTRWTLKNSNTINLYEGGVITGTGQGSYGALDAADAAVAINVKGTSTISAKLRTRNSFALNVESGTLTYTGSTSGEHTNNSVIKTGAGTIEATVAPKSKWTVNEGRVIQSVFPLYEVNIASGATFTLKNIAWTGNSDRFTGTGMLELYSESSSSGNGYTHTVTGVTFPGILKLSNKTTQWTPPKFQCNINPASEPMFADGIRPELVCDSEQTHLGDGYYRNNLEQPLQVKNLSGSGQLRGQWGSGEYYYLVETLQERDTAYDGLFGCDYSSGNRYVNLSVIGNNASEIHSLSISRAQNGNDDGGCNASTLTVADNAKVVFTSAGKWGYGQIVVDEDGWLESTNTASIARTLTLNAGSHLALTPAAAITAGTVTLPATGTVYVDMSAFGLAEGSSATIISATTLTGGANVGNLQATSGNYTFALDPQNSNAIKATNMGTCVWDGDSWNKADASLYADVYVNVAAGGTTLTLDKNYSFDSMTLSGSSGTLTIDGNGHTLTVSDIVVPNGVTLIASSALTVSGTISGGGNLTVPNGVTFTNVADSTWTIGSLENDSSINSGRIIVMAGGTLVISGQVENRNQYGSNFNGLTIEEGGLVQINPSGVLANLDTVNYEWYNSNCQSLISGELVIYGIWRNYGYVTVESTGRISVSDPSKIFNISSDISNKGQIEMIKFGFLTSTGSFVWNEEGGKLIYAPNEANVGQNITDLSKYVKFSGGEPATLTFDVSNLSALPSGTSSKTLMITSTALALTSDSLIGSVAGYNVSDYYVKQDGATGAVTLQLHAAKDSAGVYYDDIEDAFDAIVADHTLSVTILDGTEANYATELAENGLFVSGTQVSFLAAEVKDGMGVLDPVPYASVSDAINAAKNSMKYYVVAYESITMSADFSSVYIECANGVSITLNHTSGEYQYSSTPAVGSIYQYSATPKAADYTWNGGSETAVWANSSNWLFAGDEAARPPQISGDTATFNGDASIELSMAPSIGLLNIGSATVSFTATGAIIEEGNSVNLTTANGIVLTDAAATLRVRNVNLSTTPTTSVEGKYVTSATEGGWTTYTVADHKATVYDPEDAEVKKYGTVAEAVSAATDGQKVTLFANSNEAITLNGKSITFNEGSYTFTGTFTGNGTVVLTSTLKSAAAARWAAGWTGTVVLPELASIAGDTFSFNGYGIEGSIVRVNGIGGGWLKSEEVNPTIDIPANKTLRLSDFSPSFVNTFKALSGAGTFAVTYNTAIDTTSGSWYSNYSAYFLVKNVSNFTGSLSTATPGIAIGASKPAYNTPGGKIYLTSVDATLAASATPVPETTVEGYYVKQVEGVYSLESFKVITFKNYDETVLQTISDARLGDTPAYTGATPTKPADAQYTYTFDAWDPAVAEVTGNATYTATYTSTLNQYTLTIPVVEHVTAVVKVGGVATDDRTFDYGTAITIEWAAASGYRITAGATQTINSIAANTTADTPIVEAMGATVSDVSVSYGADYASATVTATISDTTLDYYISWANGEPVKGSVGGSGSQVTFDVSGINHTTEYQSADYSITAKDGEAAVTTTGGSGTSVAADTTPWFSQSSANSGDPVNGSWETAVNLSTPTNVSDNTFTTTESTSSRVVLEFNVCFSSASDADVEGTAQAAIKLGEVNSATTFMVLAPNADWTPVSRGDFVPDPSETYKVVLTIDYGTGTSTGTYGVTIDGNIMTNASGSASFQLAANKTSVQTIDFAGSGTLTSMKGDQVEGYMVVDNNGTKYATIAAAIAAYTADPTIGPLTLLHTGTAPSGWRIDGNTLIKLAKGFFFMAY